MASDSSEVQLLAAELVGGAWEPAVELCSKDEALAALVSREAAELMAVRASSHRAALPPEESAWPLAQDGVVRLAALPGADVRLLVDTLFDACVLERVAGEGTDLHRDTLRWFLKEIPDRVGRVVNEADLSGRFILNALFVLPGPEGATWMMRMQTSWDWVVNSMFQAMCAGRLPEWAPEDWVLRLAALSRERIDPRPRIVHIFAIASPPPISAEAQVHLACVYADNHTEQLLRKIAKNIRGYRTGDPALDAGLFWWNPTPDQLPLLRWILELSGEAGAREQVVKAATAEGRIDEQTCRQLAAPLERPAWADKEVPWVVADVVDVGTVRVPDGRLAVGDPWWSFEGLPFEIHVPPGSYHVRTITAAHPLHGRENGAAEVLIDPDAAVAHWELVETAGTTEGYTVEVGVGSFGAAQTLCPGLRDALPDGIAGTKATAMEVDGGVGGSLVMFTVGPQHQDCRTWAGLTSEGDVVCLLTDLGLLDLDPTDVPPPWA